MTPDVGLSEAITRFLQHSDVRGPFVISEPIRTSAGASRENYWFDLTDAAGTRPLLLRRDPGGGLLDTDRGVEFALLRALESTDVPAPRALWLDAEGRYFGRPALIMERESGTSELHPLESGAPLEVRLSLIQQLTDLLCDLQEVDCRSSGLFGVLGAPSSPADLVDQWNGLRQQEQLEPLPELDVVSHWLVIHAPSLGDAVLVHGDLKLGNVLVRDNSIAVLLDWETAHIGSRLEDLGWLTQPGRVREQQIPGVWTGRDIISRFARRTGREVPEQELLWWQIFSCLKSATIFLTGIRAWAEGRSPRSIEAPIRLYQLALALIDEIETTGGRASGAEHQ